MKAYRIEGKYSQAIFYVGYCKDVQSTLNTFFAKYEQGVKPSKRDSKNHDDRLSPNFVSSKSKTSQAFKSSQSASENSEAPKNHLSLHILLFDLPLCEYNHFNFQLNETFGQRIKEFSSPIAMHLAIVDSREESLKYIKKNEKYTQTEFQQNLFQLNQELQQNSQYDLIKAYLGEKFGISREEVFTWMQATKIKTFKDLLGFKEIPSYQKKQLRQLLSNLTLLEQLYEGPGPESDENN